MTGKYDTGLKLKTTILWYFELSKVFFRKSFIYIAIAIFVTLASQVSRIVSYFLPLKIIILVSSGHVPGYFPAFLSGVEINELIVLLSLATAGAYIMHLLLEKASEKTVALGSNLVLEKNKKIALFEKQQDIAKASYQRYVKSLANLFFITLALCFLVLVYKKLAVFILLLMVSLFALDFTLTRFFKIQRSVAGAIANNVGAASGVFFLLSFGFIIADYIYFSPPGFFSIVIGLLMCRQMANKLSAVSNEIKRINGQKNKISALFLKRNHFPAQRKHGSDIWDEVIDAGWQHKALTLIPDDDRGETIHYCFFWNDYKPSGVLSFNLVESDGSSCQNRFHFKIFDTGSTLQSIHEMTLLLDENARYLPSPKLIAHHDDLGRRYHVFDIKGFFNANSQKLEADFFVKIYVCVCRFQPSKNLIKSYKKSRSFFWEKWSEHFFKKMHVIASYSADVRHCNDVKKFLELLTPVREFLSNRALVVVNHDLRPGSVWYAESDQDKIVLSDWSRWSIEPLGAGFPANDKYLCPLDDYLKKTRITSGDVFNYKLIRLTAYLYDLDIKFSKNRVIEVITMLPIIIDAFNEVTVSE
ncbi:hypothetical protein [Kushneria konosiri]|uniref:Uncharacterized protein n=1 Tax=Kushneria konosiri TaxID=698828 RepID=A0A2Z2H3H6_9GAMM|nr:hypothetical protein [Kushneria konosiri]ARS51759.1 hypothetical protein B9G99_01660 [Kushneria konosiri]